MQCNGLPIIYRKNKIIIDTDLLNEIIGWHHSNLNHPGQDCTYKTIASVFYAAQLEQLVRNYVSNCQICKRSYVNEEEAGTYPVEFLNTLQFSGLPPHDLELKNGQFVMLLRNLNPSRGLSNGSRMQLLSMSRNLLNANSLKESMLEKKY
jgi:PIF1-like helicase/Integrase zinc binding domain